MFFLTSLMKRLVLSLFMLVFAAQMMLSASEREKQGWGSQQYRYEIRIGWGAPSDTPLSLYDSYRLSSGGRLSSIYAPQYGSLYSTGGFSAEFGVNLSRWLTLAVQTSFCGVWNDVYAADGGEALSRNRGLVFNVSPQARINWVRRPVFRLYSSAGMGFTINSNAGESAYEASFQIMPIGIAVGKDVFFFAEAGGGVSCNFLGCHLGLGYRF